ncbi:MAG: RsmD family RNA methyltransferase [Candidatus Heimdallarchaeota archaeon]|nr:RsmD family RNA methyltransferase [Candidatus Heimdallarchaeota archaeon]MCK4878353.1 RsmD family RNA methyltransferase [Candidatus Heimdallarchaeota archaeon]
MKLSEGEWKKTKEGETEFIIFKDAERIYDSSVFYNPEMTINRDLTLLVLIAISKRQTEPLTILDPLAGTGVRSYRILKELPSTIISKIYAGDRNPIAVETIQRNIDEIGFDDKLEVKHSDASITISEFIKKQETIDVIDIDPFGSPIQFIDSAIQVLQKNEGYLFVTATDLQVLCGKFANACLRIYNSIPTRNFLCHEVALRILLYNILISAGRIGIAIEPVISYHHEHFLRVKVKLIRSKEKANLQHQNIGFVYFCTECSYFKSAKISEVLESTDCPVCNMRLEKAGPLWLEQLFYSECIEDLNTILQESELPSKNEIEKKLAKMIEEAESPPFFYYLPYVLRKLQKVGIGIQMIIDSLREKGFVASRTSFDPQGLKTNASYQELSDVINLH